jgi:hypothetical protein
MKMVKLKAENLMLKIFKIGIILMIINLSTYGQYIINRVDFEDSIPSYIVKETSTSYGLKIVESPIYQGVKVGRFEVRKDDPINNSGKRSEIAFPRPDTSDLDRWYSFAVMFSQRDYDKDSYDEVIAQWHQGGGSTPPLSIRIVNNDIKLRLKPNLNSNLWFTIGSVGKGKWYHFIFHIRHSDSNGLVEIWRDKEKILTHAGPNSYPLQDYETPLFKLGIYKSIWTTTNTNTRIRVLYFDDIKIGNKYCTLNDMLSPY